MSVIARFYVSRMSKMAGSGANSEFELYPVTRGPENKEWAAATPSGSIKLTVGNPVARDWFESMLGKDVAVTFEARPMMCAKCMQEMQLDQYGSNAEQTPTGEIQHRVCPS